MEEIDQRVLSFMEENANKHFNLHNVYYAFSVDENDNICQECFAPNLMTDYGFQKTYAGNSNYREDLTSIGRSNVLNVYVGSGRSTPTLQDTGMEEYMFRLSELTKSWSEVRTGYDSLNKTDKGVIYTVNRVCYGYLNYTVALPNSTTVNAGYTGGDPNGVDGVVDSRWKQDENDSTKHYFDITEVGIGCDYSTKLITHALFRNKQGVITPIRKYHNQKLFIYIYLTWAVPEKLIFDLWDSNTQQQFLLVNGNAMYESISDDNDVQCIPNSAGGIAKNAYYQSNTITYENQNTYNGRYNHTGYIYNSGSYTNASTETQYYFANFDTTTHTGTMSANVPSCLYEDWRLCVSGYTFSNCTNSTGRDNCSETFCMTSYDEQDTAEEIVCNDIYTNYLWTDFFNLELAEIYDNALKRGTLTSISSFETLDKMCMFNDITGEWDIEESYHFDPNYYADRILWHRVKLPNIICPDGISRTVYAYHNYTAIAQGGHKAGYRSGYNIKSFTTSGITLFAADKYWDISTWTQFSNLENAGTAKDSNNHLLVKKRYFICYSDTEIEFSVDDTHIMKLNTVDPEVSIILSGYNTWIGVTVGDDTPGAKYIASYNGIIKLNDDHTLKKYVPVTNYSTTFILYAYEKLNMYGSKYLIAPNSHSIDSDRLTYRVIETNPSDSSKDYIPYYFQPFHGTHNNRRLASRMDNTRYTLVHDYGSDNTNQFRFVIIDLDKINVNQLSTLYSFTGADFTKDGSYWYSDYIPADRYSLFSFSGPNNWNSSNMTGMSCWINQYDENHELLGSVSIDCRDAPYDYSNYNASRELTYENVKYIKIKLNGNPSDRIMGACISKSIDFPIINNATWDRPIYGTPYCVYADTTDESFDTRTWHVIDMRDPIDTNGDPKIIYTFHIDDVFNGKTIYAVFGFSHYIYISTIDNTNTRVVWMQDINNDTHQIITSWDFTFCNFSNYNNSNSAYDYMIFSGCKDCLVMTQQLSHNNASASTNNIYIIPADDPTNVYRLCQFSDGNVPRCHQLQLKYMTFEGTNVNPVSQKLILSATVECHKSKLPNFVLDVGLWLKEHKWPDGYKTTGWILYGSSNNGGSSESINPSFLMDKGVITLLDKTNFNTAFDKSTSLYYNPIERYLPHHLEATTKTITAYNNPMYLSGKSITYERTNDMSLLGLSNDGAHVWDGN